MAKFERLGSLAGVVHCQVIDEVGNFAYQVTTSGPSLQVRKVNLTTLTVVDSVLLSGANNSIHTGVIDVAAGFAYFGQDTSNFPEKIYKVQLSPLAEITTLSVTDSRIFRASQIDPAGGFAYFFSVFQNTADVLISKIDLSTFTTSLQLQVGGTTLPEDAKIDVANGHIYYLEGTNIRKILTSNLTQVTSSGLGGETGTSLELRIADSYMYVGTFSGKINRRSLALADMGTTTLTTDGNPVNFLAYQAADQRLYGVVDMGISTPINVVKLEGVTNTQIRTLVLGAGDLVMSSHNRCVYSYSDRKLYIGNGFGTVADIKVNTPLIEDLEGLIQGKTRVELPSSGPINETVFLARNRAYDVFARVSGLALAEGEGVQSVVLDGLGFAYLATDSVPSTIRKINLSTMSMVSSFVLTTSGLVDCGAIDPANGFIYYGLHTTLPARVVKVNFNNMTEVGNLSLGVNSQQARACAIDTTGGFAYFTYIDSGAGDSVAKVTLSSFTVTAQINNLIVPNITVCALDVPNDRLYVAGDSGTNIKRITTSTMSVGGPGSGGTLGVGETASSMAADSTNQILYIGLGTGKIKKFTYALLNETGVLTLLGFPRTLLLDTAKQNIYLGISSTSPLSLQKVRLSDFTLVHNISLATGENGIQSQFAVGANFAAGISYWGTTAASPGDFVEVAIPSPEINLNAIAEKIILEATQTQPIKGIANVEIGLASSIAGKTIVDAASSSLISGYVQLDQYANSSFAGKVIVSAATQDSIAGKTIVAQVLTSSVKEKVILETTESVGAKGKTILEVRLASVVSGQAIIQAVLRDSFAGKAIVAASANSRIAGLAHVAIEAGDSVNHRIDLVDPPGTAIAFKTTLETGFGNMIKGSLDLRGNLMEKIIVYQS